MRELVVFLTFSLSVQNINLLSPLLEVSVSELVPVCLLGGSRAPSHQWHSCPTMALQLCRTPGAQLGWEAMGCPAPQPGTVTPGLSKVPTLCQSRSLAVSSVLYLLGGVFFHFFHFFSPQWKFHMSCSFSKTKGYKLLNVQSLLQHFARLIFILGGAGEN